jgi:Pentapeptide repeats (8 copies)
VSLAAVLVVVALAAAFTSLAYVRGWSWTGFGRKTLWDWLQLLIVPLVLAVAAYALNREQEKRDQAREDARHRNEQALAKDGHRDGLLRDYMQRMSDLVLTHDAGGPRPDERVDALTRTLTVTVVRELDGARKGLVVQFLSESGILRKRKGGPDLLDGADLRGARLERMVLDDMNLAGADLRDAQLDAAFLVGTRFFGANLRDASLHEAFIDGTDFARANLSGADFTRAAPIDDARPPIFTEACLTEALFPGTNLIGARFQLAQGRDVDFTGAELDRAGFELAKLMAVKLKGATTEGTRFPDGWRPTGLVLSREDEKELCRHLEWWRRG